MKEKRIMKMGTATPYDSYRSQAVYKTVDQAICDLVKNHDITEATPHEYIVGYVVKKILFPRKRCIACSAKKPDDSTGNHSKKCHRAG